MKPPEPSGPAVAMITPLSSSSVLLLGSTGVVPSKVPVAEPFVPVLLVKPASAPGVPVVVKLAAGRRTL